MGRVDVDGVGIEYEVTGRGSRSCCCTAFPTPGGSGGTRYRRWPRPDSRSSSPTCAATGAPASPRPSRPTRSRCWPGTSWRSWPTWRSARAHVVGHDWGAALAWALASLAPGSVDHLVALSVGHPATFRRTREQREKSWYMLLFQFPGIAERWLTEDNWANFRTWAQHPDADQVIAELEANGSLTPGLNWYRANVPPESWVRPAAAAPAGAGPHHGRLEHRRLRPHRDPDDRLRRERGGPVAIRAAGRPGPLDAAGRTRPGERAAT